MPDYTHYTDFLKDPRFLRWQLMPDEESDACWRDFINRNPHLEEAVCRASEYLKTKGLNQSELSTEDRVFLLEKIRKTIDRNVRKARIRRIVMLSAVSCAAILFIVGIDIFTPFRNLSDTLPAEEQIVGNLLNNEDVQLIAGEKRLSFRQNIEVKINEHGAATIVQENSNEMTLNIAGDKLNKLIVPYGKRTQLNLSDGSKIWLNSGSVLEFPARFAALSREICLASGEMYIEVAPDKEKPFHVQTSGFRVKVYGTKFNVSAYADSPQSVVLVEGSVGLKSADSRETILSPNQQAIYSEKGTFYTRKVDVNRIISWKDGYLTLDKTPMTEVLKQVERYYNLSFDYEQDVNLQKRTCTGKIYLSDNLDYVMATIGLLSSTKYTKTDRRIIIINEPN